MVTLATRHLADRALPPRVDWAAGRRARSPRCCPTAGRRPVRKGSDLVVQIHFHPDGKQETETFTMGIYYAKTQPQHVVVGGNVHSFRINIAPGDKNYVVTGKYTVPVDVDFDRHHAARAFDLQGHAGQRNVAGWQKRFR